MNANSERLLQQRITVRMVPVTKALGSYNSNTFDFWVYGDDRRCYAPNYPAQCCCGCSVYSGVCWNSILAMDLKSCLWCQDIEKSPIPEECLSEDVIVGIDEAGRGPVMGTLYSQR